MFLGVWLGLEAVWVWTGREKIMLSLYVPVCGRGRMTLAKDEDGVTESTICFKTIPSNFPTQVNQGTLEGQLLCS